MPKRRTKSTSTSPRDLARKHPNEFLAAGEHPISDTDLLVSAIKGPHAALLVLFM
jgi:hypothetical protein